MGNRFWVCLTPENGNPPMSPLSFRISLLLYGLFVLAILDIAGRAQIAWTQPYLYKKQNVDISEWQMGEAMRASRGRNKR